MASARRAQVPFSVVFEENQVLNRQFIELGGYFPSDMLVARNPYERFEKILDHGFWLGVAVLMPVLLGKFLLGKLDKPVRKQFNLPAPIQEPIAQGQPWYLRAVAYIERLGKHSNLQLPFEWLDKSGTAHRPANVLKRMAHNLNIAPKQLTELLNDARFRKIVLNKKIWLLGVDLFLMASNAQVKLWMKNLITPLISGKQGFSGTFNYTSEEYRREKSKD